MANAVLKSLPAVVVTASGTAIQASTLSVDRVVAVFVSAPTANTGAIQVGDLTTKYSATGSLRIGAEVAKNTTLQIQYSGHFIDLRGIFIDAVTSGDIALISYLQLTT